MANHSMGSTEFSVASLEAVHTPRSTVATAPSELEELLSKTPTSFLQPYCFFVSWQGVLTLAYRCSLSHACTSAEHARHQLPGAAHLQYENMLTILVHSVRQLHGHGLSNISQWLPTSAG